MLCLTDAVGKILNISVNCMSIIMWCIIEETLFPPNA